MAYTKLSLSALLIAITFNACGQIDMKTNKKNAPNSNSIQMQDENVIKPVKKLIGAMQEKNAEHIRAQFSKTATQAYGTDGTMKTPEETRKWLESDIISRQGRVENPQYTIINENQVVVKGQYSSRGYSSKADFLFTVENGLITRWRMRY